MDLGGKEQVSVAVRHRIEDLGNSSGTMLRLGGLNKVSHPHAMPSIELVCTDQSEPLEFSDLPFALVADTELVSHRTCPLFRRELSGLRGCIYHIGNPQCAAPGYQGAFFAYEVLSSESRERQRRRFFEVAPNFQNGFRCLVRTLLDASPVHSVLFYTDWQFGPTRAFRGGRISESSFWQQHDSHQIRLNACYTIQRDG